MCTESWTLDSRFTIFENAVTGGDDWGPGSGGVSINCGADGCGPTLKYTMRYTLGNGDTLTAEGDINFRFRPQPGGGGDSISEGAYEALGASPFGASTQSVSTAIADAEQGEEGSRLIVNGQDVASNSDAPLTVDSGAANVDAGLAGAAGLTEGEEAQVLSFGQTLNEMGDLTVDAFLEIAEVGR